MIHVLSKSFEGFSAGTVVKVDGDQVIFPDDSYNYNIPVVKLRSRSDLVPTNNRAERRASKRAEYEIMKGLDFNG